MNRVLPPDASPKPAFPLGMLAARFDGTLNAGVSILRANLSRRLHSGRSTPP
jgi:hypothetical protein